ncbi:MAG: hypothetical protein VKI39_01735 [Synechococcus sp.]|nr:hypothetical protein [Synechococcus sp.]
MSFDAHSRERLEALGRTLPQPIPQPAAGSSLRAMEKRHRVEVEENPEALFRELMQVSPDGSVPPHLIERLKQLEARGPELAPGAASSSPASSGPSPTRTKRQGRGPLGRADPRKAAEHFDLYTAFQQLLLEEESLD